MFLCRTNEPAEETTMRKTHARIGSLAFILATAFFLTPVSAQERCKVDEEDLAKNTTYTEQHAMDVGAQESPHFLMGLNFAEFSINFMRMPNHMLTNGWNEASDQARRSEERRVGKECRSRW